MNVAPLLYLSIKHDDILIVYQLIGSPARSTALIAMFHKCAVSRRPLSFWLNDGLRPGSIFPSLRAFHDGMRVDAGYSFIAK